jgi:hypothetical protein
MSRRSSHQAASVVRARRIRKRAVKVAAVLEKEGA